MNKYLRDSGVLAFRLCELEYRNRINKAIAVIWEDPEKQPTLHNLSAIAWFSPFHFHRIFKAFVGETLGEYIRCVRLVRACHALIHTHKQVTEIALSAGYETPAAFTKAFRKLYGVNPSHVRFTGRPPVVPIQTVTTNKRSRKMNPEIRELPELTVHYTTARGSINQDFTFAANKGFNGLCSYVEKNASDHISAFAWASPRMTRISSRQISSVMRWVLSSRSVPTHRPRLMSRSKGSRPAAMRSSSTREHTTHTGRLGMPSTVIGFPAAE